MAPRIRRLVGALVAVAAGVSFVGCSLFSTCGLDDREYCIGEDCICGPPCSRHDECGSEEVCAAYEHAPTHGACVDDEFAARHRLGSSGDVDGGPDGGATDVGDDTAISPDAE